MDQQNRRVSLPALVRGFITAIWVLLTTVIYSLPCILLARKSTALGIFLSRLWCSQMLSLAGARLRVVGLEKLDPCGKYIFVANLQSHFDIPALFAVLPFRLVFAAKKELFRIPFFGWGIAALGHITIDRDSARKARQSLTAAVNRLKNENICTVIFPEGTRSLDGSLGEFKRGSFTMAVESGLPVVPVFINGTGTVLPKKALLPRPAAVTITLGTPIATAGDDKETLSGAVRQCIASMAAQLSFN